MADTSPSGRLSVLPVWARMDNPIVARELAALPQFLGADSRPGLKIALVALMAPALILCSCGCVGLPWVALTAALSLLPMIWAAGIINRERAANTWESLRVTPYSTRQIVLAKMAAVFYRLLPLLALLLAGQIFSLLIASTGLAFVSFSGVVSVSGSVQQAFQIPPSGIQTPVITLLGFFLAVTLFGTTLDFVTGIVLGGLASSLTGGRGAAVLGAFGLRVLLSLGQTALIFWLVGLLSDGPNILGISRLFGLGVLGGWVAAVQQPAQFAAQLALEALIIPLQVAVLAVLFRLTLWRAQQL